MRDPEKYSWGATLHEMHPAPWRMWRYVFALTAAFWITVIWWFVR